MSNDNFLRCLKTTLNMIPRLNLRRTKTNNRSRDSFGVARRTRPRTNDNPSLQHKSLVLEHPAAAPTCQTQSY